MNTDACNYNSSALIEDECFFNETQLTEPVNNSTFEVLEIDGSLNFVWSIIDQSCGVDNYTLNIYDNNQQIVYSDSSNQTDVIVSLSELIFIEGQVNMYSWNISFDGNLLSDTFTFYLDATQLNSFNHIDNFNIEQNFPNPFNPITYFEFEIFSSDFITINIYDIKGNLIQNLANDFYSSGNYKLYWDASSYSSGIYFYEISNSKILIRKKMIIIK